MNPLDIYIFFFQFFLDDFWYHWTDYGRCHSPELWYECIISEEEMNVLDFMIDKANSDQPCYENRFLPAKTLNEDSCPEPKW